MSLPAFILGNGPTLPEDLKPLEQHLTIGVNRICRCGFVPTVVIWVDRDVWSEQREALDMSGAILVTTEPVTQEHHGMTLYAGDDCWKREPTGKALCCRGNTGVAAARWALAMGCEPVYLLGMAAEYLGGRTDFYGQNPMHTFGTLPVMQEELRMLFHRHGGKVQPIADAAELREVTRGLVGHSREHLRRTVLDWLT